MSEQRRFEVPIALQVGVFSGILIAAVVLWASHSAYVTAIRELREHEIVDLGDEARKNADTIRNTLTMLREDALTLARSPAVRRWIRHTNAEDSATDHGLRTAVDRAFREKWLLPFANPDDNEPGSALKPYLQIRLIDRDGREVVRVFDPHARSEMDAERESDELESIEPAVLDQDRLRDEPLYDKNGSDYFRKCRKYAERLNDASLDAGAVYMSPIELNRERDTDSPQHGIAVIRAAVPLVQLTDQSLEFRGAIVINLDFDQAIRALTSSPRHVVYVGEHLPDDEHPHDDILVRTIFNPQYPTIRDYLQKHETAGEVQWTEFEETLTEAFPDDELHGENNDLRPRFYSRETGSTGADGTRILPMAETGGRFPKDSVAGARLTLGVPFYLMKLDLPKAEIVNNQQILTTLRNWSLEQGKECRCRYPPVITPVTNTISLSSTSQKAIDAIVTELVDDAQQGEPSLTRRYIEGPARCQQIAAHGYRVYFNPYQPRRYLALFVGFSDEELTADLQGTRRRKRMATVFALVIGGVANFVLLLWLITHPIGILTRASERLAEGHLDSDLPTEKRNEIGRLSRAFQSMAQEILHRREHLEKQVQDRTEKLAAAVTSRDAFLATVSHELRTPLNHIFGYGQLLALTDLTDEQRSDLDKLQASGRHLLRLVQDILDYQKIILGQLPIDPKYFDINALLTSVCESNSARAAERNNRLVLQAENLAADVYNDENRIRQILDNLVGNACKFTTDGEITIEAESRSSLVAIRVRDTGIGLDEEAQKKLFKPFSKVRHARLNPDGTGLGLVISRELARKMGGDITVTSVPEEGSVFEVTVRRTMEQEEGDDSARFSKPQEQQASIVEDEKPVANEEADRTESDDSDGPRPNQVLVIDDDPKVRELITRFITEGGLDVLSAGTGGEGIELARRHLPSVITLDLMMPDVDGWSVLAALKADERTEDIPVVLVTVMDNPQKGYSFGAADYVTKPIKGDRLLQVIRRYCRQRAATVLVIDDNANDREIVRRMLRNDGCDVIEASDGRDGLERVAESSPDLIVLDLMMPVMDGFTFVEKLRESTENVPPVVVLTAKEVTSGMRDRLEGTVSEVVQKGHFDRQKFLAEIHRHLDHVSGEPPE